MLTSRGMMIYYIVTGELGFKQIAEVSTKTQLYWALARNTKLTGEP